MELTLTTTRSAMLQYLQNKGWMEPYEEVLRLEKPGEGNMNVVVRVVGDSRNLILKQSRSYVNKYPDIPAPIERINVERQFYALANPFPPLRKYLPRVIGFDVQNHLMVLDDLGKGADYSVIYKKDEKLSSEELDSAVEFLKVLHYQNYESETIKSYPDNIPLRKLNHLHLFEYPYMEDNGFNLDNVQAGLQSVAMNYKTNSFLKSKLVALGEIYLSSGPTLLHGDYYPGSWLKVPSGFKVVDPEFSFFGPPEFDLGVMLAHLRLAQQPEADIENVMEKYGSGAEQKLTAQFEGMEIIRRIIGLAQLPLDLSLEEKEELLKFAAHKILSNA